MAKRIVTKIGDIFCVEIDNKYKRFFQYFCSDMTQLNSSVIRVFKNTYSMDYIPVLKDIITDEVDFYAHTILRVGIELNTWYKVGKLLIDFDAEIKIPTFGTCLDIEYINGRNIRVDPDKNWTIWKINQDPIKIGKIPNTLSNVVQPGSVKPFIEIYDRMKYGYYRYSSYDYNTLKRRPYSYVDSYTKKEMSMKTIYQHFKGEYVIQSIELNEGESFHKQEGKPLELPLFWETNWKNSEFITEEEFYEVWDKYNKY